MKHNTIHFIDFIRKINYSSNIIINKINYADKINELFPHIESKIARNRKILSELSKEEESYLKFLTDIFIRINLNNADN
jgi:hypothetical protein